RFGGKAHGFPVRLATHDDGDWGGHSNRFFSRIQKHKADYRFSPVVARRAEWVMVSWSMVDHEEETQTLCTEDCQAPHGRRESRDQTRSGRGRQARKTASETGETRRAGRSKTDHRPAAIRARQGA